jgi:hypothetical protein
MSSNTSELKPQTVRAIERTEKLVHKLEGFLAALPAKAEGATA